MEEIIKFRPHHFMCTLGFKGHGYSLGFVKNYKKIVQKLNSDDRTLIEVVANMDSICSPCPNKLSETLCQTQAKISKLDLNHQEALNIKPGEILSWSAAKNLIKQKITVKKFEKICDGCLWKVYGVCQRALENLIKNDQA